MFVHEITLDGYAAQCAEQPIRLGTAGSYGVETLRVLRQGEWVDYDIIIAFRPPKGETVQIRLGSDNVVSVPAEATAVAGTGELTFAGYTDGVRVHFYKHSVSCYPFGKFCSQKRNKRRHTARCGFTGT